MSVLTALNELKSRSPFLYSLISFVLYGSVVAIFTIIFYGLVMAGLLPAALFLDLTHRLGMVFGVNTYNSPISWIVLLLAVFLPYYIWNRWLQPIVAVRMWIYNINHFHPNYGSKPENLDRYLARHPNALKNYLG